MDMISILKITKGNNSAKNVGGVTFANLCMSSDLYLCQVFSNGTKVIEQTRFLFGKLQRGIILEKM